MVQSPSWAANRFAASQEIPRISRNPKVITALASVRQPSLSWASPIQSIYPHPTSSRSVLILFTHLHLGLPSGLFPSGFPNNTLYTPLSFMDHTIFDYTIFAKYLLFFSLSSNLYPQNSSTIIGAPNCYDRLHLGENVEGVFWTQTYDQYIETCYCRL